MTVQMLTNTQYPSDASTGEPSLITPAHTLHLTKINIKAYSTIWAHRDYTEWHAVYIIWLIKMTWMKKLDGYVRLGLFCHWKSSVEFYNFSSSLLNSPSTGAVQNKVSHNYICEKMLYWKHLNILCLHASICRCFHRLSTYFFFSI